MISTAWTVLGMVPVLVACAEGNASRWEGASAPSDPGAEAMPTSVSVPKTPLPELPDEGGVTGIPDVVADGAVVPVIGGTLLVTADGGRAVVVDPDRDRVFVVDLASEQVTADIALEPGDVPARSAEGDDGRVFVAARGSGSLIGLDVELGSVVSRVRVCDAPRGVTVDDLSGELVVACQSGELVRVSPDGASVARTVVLEPDLRDVVSSGTRLLVSRFRSAEVLEVVGDVVTQRLRPEVAGGGRGPQYEPHIARRMQMLAGGTVVLQHQRANAGLLPAAVPYYAGSDCFGGVVNNGVSVLLGGASTFLSFGLVGSGFSPDFVVSRDGSQFAALSYGVQSSEVWMGVSPEPGGDPCGRVSARSFTLPGEATSVAFDVEDRLLVQTREPAALHVIGVSSIMLSDDSRLDTGHALFHTPTSLGVSCASCHPEGSDDGMTWNFEQDGLRRTMPIGGGILATAPFHWKGDRANMDELMADTFVSRMGGMLPSKPQAQALGHFLDTLPAAAPLAGLDTAAIARGADLFTRFGCDECHSGPHYTNSGTYDVGTGGAFQVPSLLGIGNRSPYLHDGCAPTLRDRFGPCGGDRHGSHAGATDAELEDLVAFIESL